MIAFCKITLVFGAFLVLSAPALSQQKKSIPAPQPNRLAEKALQESGEYVRSGKLAEAEVAAKNAARLAPTSPVPHNLLGLIYEQTKHLAEAEAQYRDAVRLDPKFAAAHSNLGNLLFQEEKLVEARKELEQAVRLDPLNARAHYNLGASGPRQRHT